jgi:hypothetical protein
MRVTFHPRALLAAVPLIALLWAATGPRWAFPLSIAVVIYDLLAFAGAFGTGRR